MFRKSWGAKTKGPKSAFKGHDPAQLDSKGGGCEAEVACKVGRTLGT
jgi:hypothetical protein